MLTKLPLALALLLSASILAAAELRTGRLYYLAPAIWAIGGGVAPQRIGNNFCPSAVKLTPEVDRGLPIIFTSLSHPDESVVIDENTDVLISFNRTICGELTWANPFYIDSPPAYPLVLVGKAVPLTLEATRFRIEEGKNFYNIYSIKNVDGVLQHYNLVSHRDSENNFKRLGLSREGSPMLWVISEPEGYSSMLKSVV